MILPIKSFTNDNKTPNYKIFQRIPSLTIELKSILDEKALKGENNEGDYCLTGSQKFTMMKNISETLACRVAIFEMSTLSSAKIEVKKNKVPTNPDKNFGVLLIHE
ncbi:AAA family ATPase [Peptostreptococcus anaerobius]|uniref:AAA family ATPase n=1 Tax=Peptostreptococcus anaerobius TaxID=1261 RepID=UPI002E8DDFE1|nr:AAA family ATPase [Peptostreptococcus anaerobius]